MTGSQLPTPLAALRNYLKRVRGFLFRADTSVGPPWFQIVGPLLPLVPPSPQLRSRNPRLWRRCNRHG